ncbi:MAG: 2-hydroxychromene-2-carboxylate isomerase [Alcanivorax sediminis]|uniref:2-hydroxychromene-2-carboxylate isomerase n=1 Tax=Alcanivorax sediminis TaxID=2663008 RepID=A0A6N7LQF4_9GAMM|nr:2-hydroxychromene-2-carboxylate isomerase [Alcanivorax sediminis]MQX52507.1 2-hydroxychromene-2-carboxylate isomerase [Alcanivorax sediminis]
MSKTVEFIFDVGSPTAYLAWTQLEAMCDRTGAELQLTPVLLGGIFKATGNNPPGAVPAKGMYMMRDLARYAQRYQVSLNMNPHFPVNTLMPMRIVTAAIGTPELNAVVKALYDAMWKSPCKLSETEELTRVLSEAGLDAEHWLSRAADESVKDTLKANTEAAVKRGVFGAPTLFVGNEMFFGQDRLDFVEEALA